MSKIDFNQPLYIDLLRKGTILKLQEIWTEMQHQLGTTALKPLTSSSSYGAWATAQSTILELSRQAGIMLDVLEQLKEPSPSSDQKEQQ